MVALITVLALAAAGAQDGQEAAPEQPAAVKSRRAQGGAWLELDAGPLALHHSGVRGFATGPNVRFSIGMPLGERAAAELWASGTLQSMPRGQLGDEGTAGGGIGARLLLSYIPIEVYYAKPFQRPGKGWVFGFNITPGW